MVDTDKYWAKYNNREVSTLIEINFPSFWRLPSDLDYTEPPIAQAQT